MKLTLIVLLFFIYPSFVLGNDNLTEAEAQARKKQVTEVSYDLQFEFVSDKETFLGKTLITAKLADISRPLRIDLLVSDVFAVKVNDVQIKDFIYKEGKLEIPGKSLTQDLKIEITYRQKYTGLAIKKFTDTDGAVYIYTKLEPYLAHHIFPCFDQPDIKAIFNVKVKAPKKWKVVGNELPLKSVSMGEDNVETLNPSSKMSTYLFFLGIGEYQEWSDVYQKLPLRLFARKSLAPHVDVQNIMEITKKGLKFFNEYFDYPYPFSNYGHIFVPEFTASGMEQPGAITMTESFIFRGPASVAAQMKREEVIYHEMAHMWFGNLVTMKWWNDLWLNESFATYMAMVARENISDKNHSSAQYFHLLKTWGYLQDQLSTTHPIESVVPDTDASNSSFNGITYAKGAASLKQLHFFVGANAFKSGLRHYFKKFAFGNTVRSDFTDSINQFAKSDLKKWAQQWLQTSGPNRMRIVHSCEDGKIKKFAIHQEKSVSNNLSPHKTLVGLYRIHQGQLQLQSKHELLYQSEVNDYPKLVGEKCPDFIFPNQDDHDYALFDLDQTSIKSLRLALMTLPDPLSRLTLWSMLDQFVRDQKLTPTEFMDLALIGFQTETSEDVLGILYGVFNSKTTAFRTTHFVYLTKDERLKYSQKLEEIFLKKFHTADSGTSLKRIYFDLYLLIAQSKASSSRFVNYLKAGKISGVELDQDLRWEMLRNLSLNKHPDAIKLSQNELTRDSSDFGQRMDFVVKAIYPTLENRKFAWEEMYKLFNTPYMSMREAAYYLHNGNYPELSLPFVDRYFEFVTNLDWHLNPGFVELYFGLLYPTSLCDQKTLNISKEKFSKATKLSTYARKRWTEAQDALEKCINIRQAH